jgi:hypothetical protein
MTSTPVDGQDIDPRVRAALEGLPTDFANFARTYQDHIRPGLLEKEGERQRLAARSRQFMIYAIVAGVAALGMGAVFQSQAAVAIGLIGAVAVYGFGRWPLDQFAKTSKLLLVEPVAREFGLTYAADCGPQTDVERFRELRLLPSWDRSAFEDRLEGERSGVNFSFFEAHLEEKRTTRSSNGATQTRWVTVFRGQCVRFDFHKRFLGRTLVARDMGLFNALGGLGSEMKRARLESPDFEKAFEVYTTDQVEARFLLTPDVMQRFVDLEAVFHGGKLRCCFDGGELFVAVEGGNLFEPGSMFIPLDNPERMRELLDDFGAIFRLMDDLGPRARSITSQPMT